MLELKIKDVVYDMVIYEIFIDGEYAGSLEGNYQAETNSFFIENIKKSNDYKGKEVLKKVVDYLHKDKKVDIGCLPLPKYRSYYEKLGFKKYLQHGEDIFYQLKA